VTVVMPSPVDRFRHNISTCDADGPVSLLQTRLNTTALPKALQRGLPCSPSVAEMPRQKPEPKPSLRWSCSVRTWVVQLAPV
jgi:hypothetical protein